MILLVTCICSTVVLNDDDQWSRPAKADPPCKKMYYSYSIGYSVTAVERGYDLLPIFMWEEFQFSNDTLGLSIYKLHA